MKLKLASTFNSHVWIELHDDQELWLSVGCRPLIGSQEAADVVMLLQQREAVDRALVGKVLPVSRAEDFDGHAALVKTATKHYAVTPSTNQLSERRTDKEMESRCSSGFSSTSSNIQILYIYTSFILTKKYILSAQCTKCLSFVRITSSVYSSFE